VDNVLFNRLAHKNADRFAGDARRQINVWREYYNKARPHSALQWITLAEFACRPP
jgi:transposase InsO family protein